MDFNERLNKMLSTLNSVCDATGILRVFLITDIYSQIKDLNSELTDEFDKWKQEKIRYETEIADLKEKYERKD